MDTFKFVTQITNPCGNGISYDEYLEKMFNKEAAGKACPEDEKGKAVGPSQVISDKGEAGEGHQDGESVKGKKEETKSETKAKVKEAAGKAEAEDCPGEGVEVSLPADKEFQKGESEDGSKVTPKNKKVKASSKPSWVKISKLNEPNKKMLRQYWLTMFPREYVESMVRDQ